MWVHATAFRELKVWIQDKSHPRVLDEFTWTHLRNCCHKSLSKHREQECYRTGLNLKTRIDYWECKPGSPWHDFRAAIKQGVCPCFPWSISLSNNGVHHLQVEPFKALGPQKLYLKLKELFAPWRWNPEMVLCWAALILMPKCSVGSFAPTLQRAPWPGNLHSSVLLSALPSVWRVHLIHCYSPSRCQESITSFGDPSLISLPPRYLFLAIQYPIYCNNLLLCLVFSVKP